MSPGGFDSVATGFEGWVGWVDDGAGDEADGWVDEVAEVAVGPAEEPDEPPPLQDETSTAAVRLSASKDQIFMGSTLEIGG